VSLRGGLPAHGMFAAMARLPRMRPGPVPAIALVLLLAATLPSGASAAKHDSKKKPHHVVVPPAEVTLSAALTSGPGAQVTMAPVGLSLEYPVMAQDLGSGACPPPALVAALQQLGSPPLSLEGGSQDMTAPSGALTGPPGSWEAATTYPLPGGFWSQLHCLLSATGDPLTVGLNARTGKPGWAAQMVAGAQSAATAGLDFSLGNEPDLYYLPDYSSLDKPQVGEEAVDIGDYLQVAAQLQQEIGGEPVLGPELARPAHWQSGLTRVVGALHAQELGVHLYPLTACSTPRAVTIGGLLSAGVGAAPSRLAWVVADAVAAKVPAIISEANSASCGGVAGVSDSPASAVWAARFVLAALKTGFREVRFHFAGDAYDPFVMRGTEVLDRPIDSALVALNQWLPIGSTIRTVQGVKGLLASGLGEPGGTGVLVLDNEQGKPRSVLLRGATRVHLQELSPFSAGLKTILLSAVHGRVGFSLAGNTLAAISLTP
jgi:hypothetical protein